MFNNRFNSSKNDPLVEAVKAAQHDGECRRQAEKIVNEEFGVYSRKAVVREHLAAYDAALEEAYKCMKEGKPLAKKDHDGDGKIESEKDEVWGSRFRAAKAAGMNEAQLDELKKPTAKTAMKAYYRAYDSDVQSGEGERSNRLGNWKQKHLPGKSARNQKDTGKAELDDYDRKTVKKSGTLTKASQKDTKAEIKSRLGKHTKPKNLPEEALDEISKELAGRYIKKADYKRSDSSFQSGKVYGKELATKKRTKQDVEDARKHNRDSFKREKGINTAVNKLTGKAKVQANEEVMKESIKAKLLARHMKEDSSF